MLKRQHVEDPIQYPRYLIGATGQGASALRRQPLDPLPLSELIFLYTDDDIRVWLLASPGKDPLDLLVLESRQDLGEAEMKPRRQPPVNIHFSIVRPGTGGGSGMTWEPGTTTTMTTTTRV